LDHLRILVCEHTPADANLKRTADEVLSLVDEHGARLHALLLRFSRQEAIAQALRIAEAKVIGREGKQRLGSKQAPEPARRKNHSDTTAQR